MAVQGTQHTDKGPSQVAPRRKFNWSLWASRHRYFLIEVTVLAAVIFMVILGPSLMKIDPEEQILARVREPPNASAILGRDELGRDILSRLVYGARYTVGIGFATVVVGVIVGGALGLVAGYYGGRFDTVIMRLMDMALAFPSILLAIVLIAVLGTGLTNVVIAVGATFVPNFSRLVRAQTLQLREEQFVVASHSVGASGNRIMRRHIVPNVLPCVFVQFTYALGEGIINVAGLGFLGLGIQPPTPEWGVMLSRAREAMFAAPHMVVMPGLALVFLLLTVNLLGDSLRDIIDPWLSRSR
jgi:peptide/nickel transport system permease protein